MKNGMSVILGTLAITGLIFAINCGGDDEDTSDNACPVGTVDCPCAADACN